jgi:phosphopantothenoylcysteine decarboxylase/phosphopantothenate--cysteine ligase
MNCVVTAGPTFEPLDQVRRLTNFSTGRLGSELANLLAARGHDVTLLLGEMSVWAGEQAARIVERFSTTADLRARLQRLAAKPVDAVLHAAAVSDFTFGRVWQRLASGELVPPAAGKIPTRAGDLLAELVPTPKIIAELRAWFPEAILVGWKFEVDGGREQALVAAARQMRDCHTDACVINGPAYGAGFGLMTAITPTQELADRPALFNALASLLSKRAA